MRYILCFILSISSICVAAVAGTLVVTGELDRFSAAFIIGLCLATLIVSMIVGTDPDGTLSKY